MESNSNVNALRIGISSLEQVEEKVKAFIKINPNVKKRRYIISRENIFSPEGNLIVKKSEIIDISKVKLLRRVFQPLKTFKTFQPDEGIVLVSSMESKAGIQISIDLVTQIINIEGGAYESFIERIDSFTQMQELLKRNLFPKLVVVGHIPLENLEKEQSVFKIIQKEDPYVRFIEVKHTDLKTNPVFPGLRQINIPDTKKNSWKQFTQKIIQEYTKPYAVD